MRLFAYRVAPADGVRAGESPLAPASVRDEIQLGDETLRRVGFGDGIALGRLLDDETVETVEGVHARRSDLRPAPAIPRPGKIICVGLNYHDHIAEQHIETPSRPMLFSKFENAVIGDGDAIVCPQDTHALDAEVELGVVIGRRARGVARNEALEHVLGFVTVNDVTARDWQGNKAALQPGERGDGQWLRAKGSDTFLPMSPVIALIDQVPDPGRLALRCWWHRSSGANAGDDVLMQDSTTARMIFDVPAIIEFASAVITLEPGDVIATGTPSGVGVFREPPVFLRPGDRVRCEIDGIGGMENPVVGWSART